MLTTPQPRTRTKVFFDVIKACCLIVVAVDAGGAVFGADGDLLPYRISNCGINAIITATVLLGHAVSEEDIGSKIPPSADPARALSLSEIKSGIDAYGLRSEAIHFDDATDLEDALKTAGLLVIVHLKTLDGENHFVVCRRVRGGEIEVFDYPKPHRTITQAVFEEWLHEMGSGYALLVAEDAVLRDYEKNLSTAPAISASNEGKVAPPPPRKEEQEEAAKGPSSIEGRSISVPGIIYGSIDSGSGEFEDVPLEVSNKGNRTLKLEKTKGSCNCFKGAELPPSLAPGEKAVVRLRFKRQSLQYGAAVGVILFSDDELKPQVQIEVRFPKEVQPGRCVIVPRGEIAAEGSERAYELEVLLRDEDAKHGVKVLCPATDIKIALIDQSSVRIIGNRWVAYKYRVSIPGREALGKTVLTFGAQDASAIYGAFDAARLPFLTKARLLE